MSNSVIVQTKKPDGLCKEGFTGAGMMITVPSSPISQTRWYPRGMQILVSTYLGGGVYSGQVKTEKS